MNVQVLLATMHQTDHSLLEKMNIQTDIIVGNQCDQNSIENFEYEKHNVLWLSFAERGVGLNRNNALMRANSDIVLFADDDVVYYDDYADTICKYYQMHPKADVVIFNFKMRRGSGEYYDRVKKAGRVTRWTASKYGTYCITARTERLRMANIYFHLQFGGGAKYSCGEDSIFLQDCIKKGLRVYATKDEIGVLDHGVSTWFNGYTDKYFYDKGIVFSMIHPCSAYLFSFFHCIKNRKKYCSYGCKDAIMQMFAGVHHRRKKQL